ncbi:MAG: hypothetical protein GWP09_01570 [Nitrospiraceae bacterium]|nr:hypothetical protein [Nitrospiraceae bacterium]
MEIIKDTDKENIGFDGKSNNINNISRDINNIKSKKIIKGNIGANVGKGKNNPFNNFKYHVKYYVFVFALLILITATLLNSYSVKGLAISPAKRVVDFHPGKTDSGGFMIANNDGVPLKITIMPSKAFSFVTKAENISLSNGNRMSINYKIVHPKTIGYGTTCYPITIKSIRPHKKGTITAQLSLVYQYCIFVPYPGEYAVIDGFSYSPMPAPLNQNITLVVGVKSLGTDDVKDAYVDGVINCNDLNVPFKSNKKTIFAGSSASFNTNVKIGKTNAGYCKVLANLHYENKERKKQFGIVIARKDIKVVNMKTKFTQGKIQQFYVMLKNDWYKTINDAGAILIIKTPNGNVTIKTVPDSIDPLKTKTFFGTYTAKSLKIGKYNATLEILFNDPTNYRAVKKYVIEVVPYDTNELTPITGAVNGTVKGNNQLSTLLMVNILVVVVAVVFVMVLLLRRKDNVDSDL